MIVGERITLPQVHTWQVYLAKQPNFLGVQEGDQINLNDYELVAKIDGEYPPFQVAQNIDDAWVDNDTTLEVYGNNQGGCRSLSVSDIVCNTITKQCYIVNGIGYHLLLDSDSKSADTSDTERFIDNIYCEWCGELYDGTEILDNYTAKIVHRRCAASDKYDAESFKSAEGDPEWMSNKDLRRRLFLKSQKEGGVPKICEVCEDAESNLLYYQEDGEQFVVCKNCLEQSMDDWKTIFGHRPKWNAESSKNPMRSAIIKGLRNAAKDGYVVAAPPYGNRSANFYNNLAQIILEELGEIGTEELGPEVSGAGRAIDPYRVVADLASGRSVEIESPDEVSDYSVGIADMIISFTQQSTIMDKNDGFIPPEGYTLMRFDLPYNGMITRRLAWWIANAMGIYARANDKITLYSTPQKNRNSIMIINMLLEELQPEVSSMTDGEKEQYYQEFGFEIMRQVGYYNGPLQEEKEANKEWAENNYGTVEKIDAVVVSASIQEKARSDAARLNPFRAETFEGNFSESMDKHITYEVSFTSSLPMDEDYDYDDRIIQDYVEELIRDDGSRKGIQSFEFVMGSGWYSGSTIDGTVTWWTGNYSAETFEAESCDYCEEPVAYLSDIKDHPKCEHGWHLYCNSCIGAEDDFCPLCVEGEDFEAPRYQKQKECAVCLSVKPYNKMMSCFVCGQNYCENCEKYDSCVDFEALPYGNYYGACLLPDGSCTETSLEMCRSLGGRFQGPGTSCYPDASWVKPRVMRADSGNQCGYDWKDGEGPCPDSAECNECGRCSECCQDHNGWECEYCDEEGWGDISMHTCPDSLEMQRKWYCSVCNADLKDRILYHNKAGDPDNMANYCQECDSPFCNEHWDGNLPVLCTVCSRVRNFSSESRSSGLDKGFLVTVVAGAVSGLVAAVFGTVISEIILDRLREDPELEITEEDPGTNTP